jgi:hypothetical protein
MAARKAGPYSHALTTVAAAETTFASMAEYPRYVRDPARGYVTVAFPVGDGMEISSWTGVSRDRSG